MSVIPCRQDPETIRVVESVADAIREGAHALGDHGLSEEDFHRRGVFKGAIERLRGQTAATMSEKRAFVRLVLNHMQDTGCIQDYQDAGSENRFDYSVTLPSGRVAVIELKGCMDGNNTNIFERPAHANEFIIWSICQNAAADPRKNVWSGLHTRLSSEIITTGKIVDGVVVWDWLCGSIGRICPKVVAAPDRATTIGQYEVPPPCIYLLPGTMPSVRNNPSPAPHSLDEVELLKAMHECFKGDDAELNYVRFSVEHNGSDVVRRTQVERGGSVQRQSRATAIRRK